MNPTDTADRALLMALVAAAAAVEAMALLLALAPASAAAPSAPPTPIAATGALTPQLEAMPVRELRVLVGAAGPGLASPSH